MLRILSLDDGGYNLTPVILNLMACHAKSLSHLPFPRGANFFITLDVHKMGSLQLMRSVCMIDTYLYIQKSWKLLLLLGDKSAPHPPRLWWGMNPACSKRVQVWTALSQGRPCWLNGSLPTGDWFKTWESGAVESLSIMASIRSFKMGIPAGAPLLCITPCVGQLDVFCQCCWWLCGP